MNRTLRSGYLALFCFLLPWSSGASWTTNRYDVDLEVKADGKLQVTEKIEADFTQEPHHGIYRDIPLEIFDVSLGKTKPLRFHLLFVDDGEGRLQPVHESRTGKWYHLKIGDGAITFQEVRKYRIVYEVENWCLSFGEHQELYWNAIGTEWLSAIKTSGASVTLPSLIDREKVKVEAYRGTQGSRSQDARIRNAGGMVEIAVPQPLRDHEGLTVRISWPGSPVPLVPRWKIWWWAFMDHLVFLFPLVTFIFMLLLWWKKGRDPKDRETITVQYHPPEGLTSMTSGTLMDEYCDIRDITAGIIELAVRGFLKIVQKEEKVLFFNNTQYAFHQVEGKDPGPLPDHLRFLYQKIFSYGSKVNLSDLDQSFYAHLPEIRRRVYKDLIDGGHFSRNPETVRVFYYAMAALVVIGGFFGWFFLKAGFFQGEIDVWDILAILAAGFVVAWFGYFMPARTFKGVQAKERLLGLEEYIKRAEAESLKYDEKQNVFEEILPFAMALGLSSKWSRAFSGAFNQPPSWYYGPTPTGGWSPRAFEHSLTHACSTMGNNMSSAPRSSGGGSSSGGFSGGGGGGGGGGAW